MADNETVHKPGGFYSGQNKIPTINEFVSRLDRDKKNRDREIDEARQQQKKQGGRHAAQVDGEAKPHENELHVGKNQKKVRDPTSGRDIVIEDFGKEAMGRADNPTVSSPQ